jgi:hypothetical protein
MLCAGFALLLACCSSETPEAAIKREIAAMQASIEKREPAGFLKYVTDDFQAQSGQVDRQALRGMLASQLVAHNRVAVTLGQPEITVHGDRATVKVSALVVGGQWLPENGKTLEIESGWQREGKEWKCYAASWK